MIRSARVAATVLPCHRRLRLSRPKYPAARRGQHTERPSMAVHVVLNQKGGVGKSTIAVNLAAVTADVLNHEDDPDSSSPVLALSGDPQGSAVWWASRMNDLPFHIAQGHDDLDGLKKIKQLPGIKHVYVDTPGWIDLSGENGADDPLGRGPAADVLRPVLGLAA